MKNWTNDQFKQAGGSWVARHAGKPVACGDDVEVAYEYVEKGYFVEFLFDQKGGSYEGQGLESWTGEANK